MSSLCLSCPRNGKRVWICQCATVSNPKKISWEGGESRLVSPDTGLKVRTGDAAGGASERPLRLNFARCAVAFQK